MTRPSALRLWSIAAVLFGVLTVFSGGRALFGDAAARASLGQVVGFVLWFNFLAGFAYVGAGVGLWLGRDGGRWLALALAAGTALVAAAFGVHALSGGGYEMRTVGALVLRLGFWLAVSWVAHQAWRAGALRG